MASPGRPRGPEILRIEVRLVKGAPETDALLREAVARGTTPQAHVRDLLIARYYGASWGVPAPAPERDEEEQGAADELADQWM